MKTWSIPGRRERGLSLVGFIFMLALVGLVAVVAMKVVPTVVEFSSIKKAIANAKTSGNSPKEIQDSFDKQASAGYITSVNGRDLEVVKSDDGGYDVNVAYEKKISLVGPASLVIDYQASTAKGGGAQKPAQ